MSGRQPWQASVFAAIGGPLAYLGAARNAGCPVVCVPYGYNHGQDIRDAQPDAVIESITDLPALLV